MRSVISCVTIDLRHLASLQLQRADLNSYAVAEALFQSLDRQSVGG